MSRAEEVRGSSFEFEIKVYHTICISAPLHVMLILLVASLFYSGIRRCLSSSVVLMSEKEDG